MHGDLLAEVGEAQIAKYSMAAQRQIGAVELQDEAGVDDRLIFLAHHIGEGENIFFFSGIVDVL